MGGTAEEAPNLTFYDFGGVGGPFCLNIDSLYDTVSDVVESKVDFDSKILTPNRMD